MQALHERPLNFPGSIMHDPLLDVLRHSQLLNIRSRKKVSVIQTRRAIRLNLQRSVTIIVQFFGISAGNVDYRRFGVWLEGGGGGAFTVTVF